jgi:hypothetical protein
MAKQTNFQDIPGLLNRVDLDVPLDSGPYKIRIIATGIAKAADIFDHEGNPFVPTEFQQAALRGSLTQVGVVDVLKCYVSERNGNRLTLMDGHKRKGMDPNQLWPVIVLDLDDDEADAQLAVHNLIGAWSGLDPLKMDALLKQAKAKNAEMAATQERIRSMIADNVALAEKAATAAADESREKQFKFDDALAASVKVVVPVAGELPVIERALKATGHKRRGAALLEIANFYLENKQ